jgi:hypothetical protein
MNIDARQATNIVHTVAGDHPLAPAAADAIIAIAWIAIDADRTEDEAELGSIDAISAAVRERARLPASTPPAPVADVPTDDEEIVTRLSHLKPSLPDTASRELAYTFAHVLTIVDLQIQPSEDSFLVILARELGIAEDRAQDLAASVVESLTPDV